MVPEMEAMFGPSSFTPLSVSLRVEVDGSLLPDVYDKCHFKRTGGYYLTGLPHSTCLGRYHVGWRREANEAADGRAQVSNWHGCLSLSLGGERAEGKDDQAHGGAGRHMARSTGTQGDLLTQNTTLVACMASPHHLYKITTLVSVKQILQFALIWPLWPYMSTRMYKVSKH